MVLHSTKNLTKPENVMLQTKERSVSKIRDNSKDKNKLRTEGKYTSRNFNKRGATSIQVQQVKIDNYNEQEAEDKAKLDMFNFDIDEFIQKEEAKII